MTDFLKQTIAQLRTDMDAALAAGDNYALVQLEMLIRQYQKTLASWETLQTQPPDTNVVADVQAFLRSK